MGNTACVSSLLAHGASTEASDNNRTTALMYASLHNRGGTIKLLLAAGANHSRADRYGLTALDMAVIGRAHTSIQLLQAKGAHLSTQLKQAQFKIGDWGCVC